MKKILICFLIFYLFFLISCNSSIENKNLKNLTNPCEFVNIKMEIYKKISIFYDKYSDFENYKEVEMVDFSRLMKLWQKNDEIDFQIGLNHWEEIIKSCEDFKIIDSLQRKMNI